MSWVTDPAFVEPVLTVLGGVVATFGKVWLDRRKSRRETEARQFREAQAARAERADERDHEVVTALISATTSGLEQIRDQIVELHAQTVGQIAAERRESNDRYDKLVGRLERLSASTIAALAKANEKTEIRRG